MSRLRQYITLIVILKLVCCIKYRPHIDVRLKQGVVRGYRVDKSPAYYEFLGVPYAAAPLTLHRFKSPLSPPKWDGIFEATHRVCCPQPGGRKCDENCLIVNIFAPVVSGPHSVIIHVHDGDFNVGSGATAPPTRLVRDFIVVTFNYRLGALGYLCLGDETDANFGLQDQAAAIAWVYRNIKGFGGDHNKISIFASGSGAASIHLLLTTTALHGLVYRVILESEVALSPFSLTYDPIRIAKNALGLDNRTSNKDVFKKYKSAKINTLIKSMVEYNNSRNDELFRPCLASTNELATDPLIALMDGYFYKVPMIFIYANNEVKHDPSDVIANDNLPYNLQFPDDNIKSKLIKLINDFYFENMFNEPAEQMNKYFNDINIYPLIKSAQLHARNSDRAIFLMEYNFSDLKESVFNSLYANEGFDDSFVSRLVTLLGNFAKFGDPTPLKTMQIPIIWEPINKISQLSSVRALHLHELTMKSPTGIKRMEFWDKIYMKFYKPHIPIS